LGYTAELEKQRVDEDSGICKIEMPASLRSEDVPVHPGMPFGFPSESAFGFAGILRWTLHPLELA
jgi:hypothetical protein